jgi:hypothetical protein
MFLWFSVGDEANWLLQCFLLLIGQQFQSCRQIVPVRVADRVWSIYTRMLVQSKRVDGSVCQCEWAKMTVICN